MRLLVLCSYKDQIVMVNGVSMENVYSTYTIQNLKSCGKTANVVSTEEAPTKMTSCNLVSLTLWPSLVFSPSRR